MALRAWSQHPALLCVHMWTLDSSHNGGTRASWDLKTLRVTFNHFHGIWHGSVFRESPVGLGVSFTGLKGARWCALEELEEI